MEIPASLFFGIWSNIGVISLYLGFNALHNTDLPASISPTALSLFKHFLAIAASHSSTLTLVFHTKLKIHVLKYYALFLLVVSPVAFSTIAAEASPLSLRIYCLVNASVLLFYFLPWKKTVLGDEFFHALSIGFILFPLLLVLAISRVEDSFMLCSFVAISNFMVIFQPCYAAVDLEQSCLTFHFFAMFTLLVTTQSHLSPILVLLPSLLTCIAQEAIAGDERFRRWLPAAESLRENWNYPIFSELNRMVKGNGNVIEFSVGMAGTVLFQYFFRVTTLDHVVAFLYFAVAWVANLALLLCRRDFGVFNFFLSNVIVGCTVSQFGVGRTTWIAYLASLLLYILRVKLELLCVVNRDGKEAVVTWRHTQTEETNQIVHSRPRVPHKNEDSATNILHVVCFHSISDWLRRNCR